MLTETQRQERNRVGHRRWYGENRDEYNALRRERYAENKEARAKAQQRAADYRQRGKIAIERTLIRVHPATGLEVPVFSTGQVAALLSRTPQTFRYWEQEGMIPASIFPDSHRLYTIDQVSMLVDLALAIKITGGWQTPEVQNLVQDIFASW